jgi:hypothetical protein
MIEISYAGAAVPVRDDLPAAHGRQWRRLAEPGAWWTGAERVAIAAEVRNAARCPLCRERKAALSAEAVAGEHQSLGALSDAAIDVIHRVVTDPGRLSKSWFEKSCAGGLSDGRYVELIGVLVTVVSIDSFCRGLGVPLHPLPEPLPGDPSRYRPPAAELEGAWVPMIPAASASGDESDLWTRGRTGNVLRALSLVPDEVRGLNDLSEAHYLTPEQMMDFRRGRTLDREQIELIAGRVSALRECFY